MSINLQSVADMAMNGLNKVANVFSPEDGETPIEIVDGEKYYKAALAEQKPFHPTWFRQIALFAGQHWIDWSAQTNWFQETAAPTWRVRLTTNLILPTIRTMIANELKTNPRFYGVPANGDLISKAAARIASRIFEAKYYDDDFLNMMIRMRTWARMTGSSYLFALWDPSAGKTWSDAKIDPMTGQPVIDPATGQPVMQQYAAGDIMFDVANSFEVLLQPGAPENFAEHRKIMRVKLMDVDEIEDRWGVKVEPEKGTTDIMYQVRVMSMVDASGRFRTDTAESSLVKNRALVKNYFEVPSKKYPNGRIFTYANGKVLSKTEDLDYFVNGKRALPVGKDDDIFMPGRSQGSSTIEHIGPINVQYNKMNSQTIENCNLLSRPKVTAAKGAMDDDVFTDQPAEVVEFNVIPGAPDGGRPEPFKQAEMPTYFFEMKKDLPQMIENISGIHDVSLGRLPRRANSGVAIDALQEADNTHIALSIKSWGSALSRVMTIALEQMQRKYTEERIVHYVGKLHQMEVVAFKGADLIGCGAVRVTFGPHLTKAQRSDLALQLLEAGVISREQALEIMELGDIDEIFDAPPPMPMAQGQNPNLPPGQPAGPPAGQVQGGAPMPDMGK